MNRNTILMLFKRIGLGTVLTGITMAQGASSNYSYPFAINNRSQAQQLLKAVKNYLDIFNFESKLDKLDIYELILNPGENQSIKNLKKHLSSFKPYELGYFYCLYIRHLHTLGFDLGKDGIVVPWDGKNNSCMDKAIKDYKCENIVSFDLKNVQTQRGVQHIYMDYLNYWGQEKKEFPKRIFTLEQAQQFTNDILNYLKIFNYETNTIKDLVKDKLSITQRAEQTLYLIFKDVIQQYKDYGRKYMRIICLHFLHTKNLDWDEKNNIIKWDRKNNNSAETVESEQFAGNEVRDMLLAKLQQYFGEASIEELKCLSAACAEWGCK